MSTLNLIGEVFGRLTVIAEAPKKKYHRYWVCKCTCGITREFGQTNLRSGKSTSCGCYATELAGATYKSKFEIHGDHKARLYRIHKNMWDRCTKIRDSNYPRYGAVGISVFAPWKDYLVFKEWALSSGYREDLTLDRIDSELNYSPENCRWATYTTQTRNRRKQKNPASSKYIGVSREVGKTKWRASVCVNGTTHRLGYFDDEVSAAKARDTYIRENHLEHFKLNF